MIYRYMMYSQQLMAIGLKNSKYYNAPLKYSFCGINISLRLFNVLLTVHLSLILITDQLNAQILFYIPLHTKAVLYTPIAS